MGHENNGIEPSSRKGDDDVERMRQVGKEGARLRGLQFAHLLGREAVSAGIRAGFKKLMEYLDDVV